LEKADRFAGILNLDSDFRTERPFFGFSVRKFPIFVLIFIRPISGMNQASVRNAQVNVCQIMPRYAVFFQVSGIKKARLNWSNVLCISGGGAENRIPHTTPMNRHNAKSCGEYQEWRFSKPILRLFTSGR
jgi:hypothetical protein